MKAKQRMHLRLILFLFLLLITAGCNDPVSTARSIGVTKLRQDLKILSAQHLGKNEIPATAWPESIRKFSPVALQHHMNGMLIVTNRHSKEQEGLLIMLDPNEDPGAGGSGVSYESRGDGLYWCEEVIRAAFIQPPGLATNQ